MAEMFSSLGEAATDYMKKEYEKIKEREHCFDVARKICEKIIREECCYKCHDGVCETCNVGRALKRLEGRA